MANSPPELQRDALRRLTQQLLRRFGALAADSTPCGQPLSLAHAHALIVLLRRGELAQQELGAELGIDKSNVARLCTKMVEAGSVVMRRCEHDGRSRRVSLTRGGERLAGDVDAASCARFDALLAALPARRRGAVIEALDLLVVALDALPTDSPPRNHE